MAEWKKVVVSGSQAELSTVTVDTNIINSGTVAGSKVTGSFTGSFNGDGSSLTGITATSLGNSLTDGNGIANFTFDGSGAASVAVEADGTTLTVGASGVKVSDAGINVTQLNTNVAGTGIAGGGGSALSVDLNQLDVAAIDVANDSFAIIDANDSKTQASENKALKDYTPYLKSDGMQGKRIGLYTAPLGNNPQVDSLVQQSVRLFKTAGATVIEIDEIAPRGTGQNSFQVMLHEYKAGLNDYFASLGENAPIKNLKALIAFNEQDSIALKYYNQAYLKMAQEKEGLDSEAYQNALANLQRMSQQEGIDNVMNEHQLDAIIAPTGSPAWSTDWLNGDNFHIGSSSAAAWAGYPNITIPMGNIHGLPVGLSIFGRAWSEPILIEIAYGFEQKSNARIVPTFRKNDEE